MRKYSSLLAVALLSIFFTMLPATPALALGGEYLSCRVSGSASYTSPCYSAAAPNPYFYLTFKLFNLTGSYTYSWVKSGSPALVAGGCTSADNFCYLRVNNGYNEVTATVTLTQDGSSATYEATAVTYLYCGNYPC